MRLTIVGTFSPDLLLRYLYKFAQRYMEYVCVCAYVRAEKNSFDMWMFQI